MLTFKNLIHHCVVPLPQRGRLLTAARPLGELRAAVRGLSKPSPVGEGGPLAVDEELASLSTKPYKLLIRLLLRKIHLPSQGKAMCARARRRDRSA